MAERGLAYDDDFESDLGQRDFAAERYDDWYRSRRSWPKNYVRSDERIREDIYEHLPHPHFNGTFEISVEVKGGHVTLFGSVPHRAMKHWIEDMAAATPGVSDVDNRLTVPLTAPWPDESAR